MLVVWPTSISSFWQYLGTQDAQGAIYAREKSTTYLAQMGYVGNNLVKIVTMSAKWSTAPEHM